MFPMMYLKSELICGFICSVNIKIHKIVATSGELIWRDRFFPEWIILKGYLQWAAKTMSRQWKTNSKTYYFMSKEVMGKENLFGTEEIIP